MQANLLLTIRTALHRYVVHRTQVSQLLIIHSPADLEQVEEQGPALVSDELGHLLDPRDVLHHSHCHAIVVPLRRRRVALLVERVEDIRMNKETPEEILPLPRLLAATLAHPWYLGVVVRDDTPLLVLDMRQIARHLLVIHKKNA